MARPRKRGRLDWFKMTTQWDEKMEALLDECGAVGGFAMQTLWMELYRTENGYLSLQSPLVQRSIARKARIQVDELLRVISVACEVGLLDSAVWGESMALKSYGVDKRLQENEESREVEREKKTKGKPRENSGKLGNIGENEFSPNCSTLLSSTLISSDLLSSDLLSSEDQDRAREADSAPEKLSLSEFVRLTQSESDRLTEELGQDEFAYWVARVDEFASKNPAKWRKGYQDHNRVIRSWRTRKLEEGYQWNPTQKIYQKANTARGAPPTRPTSIAEHNEEFFRKRELGRNL